MDLDAFAAAHTGDWIRLDVLSRRSRLSGAEADELIVLYQRVATHLSAVRTHAPDPGLVARLSGLVARARAAVAGPRRAGVRSIIRFVTVDFPAATFRAWRWWCAVATAFSLFSMALMARIAADPALQTRLASREEIRQLVERDFAGYYSESPAQDFAAQVWTNNAFLAALCLASGIVLVPVVLLLWNNAVGIGTVGGILIGAGRADLFFGLVVPHGLLELTAVFVAAGVGLRTGWAWIAPGAGRTRAQAVGEAGRSATVVALGLVGVLAISGLIEAFVTPSTLPTSVRIGIGMLAWLGFLGYVVIVGGPAVRRGQVGDVDVGLEIDGRQAV
jgi:uncharacterized membrane protein SpoIIM required for sporulation